MLKDAAYWECSAQKKCKEENVDETKDDYLLGWIQISSGASSLIDTVSLCAVLDFDKIVFVGAVGFLVAEIPVGALCTPSWCVSGNLANGYLLEDIKMYKPFGRV